VRYERAGESPLPGVVRPVVRRVLEQMKAASVLTTSKAAARSVAEARRTGEAAIAQMRQYASLLGEEEARDLLAEEAQIMNAMASPVSSGLRFKEATYAAVQRQRGSKDFDRT
jgi:hypothetical protein